MDKFGLGDIIKNSNTGHNVKVVKVDKNNYTLNVNLDVENDRGSRHSKYYIDPTYTLVKRGSEGMSKTLYTRQDSLNLKVPVSVAVVGVGGVGSWVASDFALSGVDNILIIDPDIVELSNLNRTPFKMRDEGIPKVEALMEYILERRLCEITPIQERVENVEIELFDDYELIVDCRDTSEILPEALQKKCRITGGYDGMNITIHINPSDNSVFGKGATGYQITPSWLIPPRLISTIILTYVMASRPRTKEFIHNINLKGLITKLLEVKLSEVKEVIENEAI
tara:strand:+ start:1779 stop:2621 length:843 start_codon:yes stop_codon:yes gene_type:complete